MTKDMVIVWVERQTHEHLKNLKWRLQANSLNAVINQLIGEHDAKPGD